MSDWLQKLEKSISELSSLHSKFYSDRNRSAGTKARKILQDIKIIAQEGRTDIQEVKASRSSVRKPKKAALS